MGKWVGEAVIELAPGHGELVVARLKSTTDVRWWHDHVEGKAEYRFIRGRLRFGGAKGPAPFPSVIVVWHPHALASRSAAAEQAKLEGV